MIDLQCNKFETRAIEAQNKREAPWKSNDHYYCFFVKALKLIDFQVSAVVFDFKNILGRKTLYFWTPTDWKEVLYEAPLIKKK